MSSYSLFYRTILLIKQFKLQKTRSLVLFGQSTSTAVLVCSIQTLNIFNLYFRSGFVFTEQNVHRIPTDPTQEGGDTSVSFYALYPNGVRNGTDIPVPKQVLSEAIKENLDNIRASTGLDSLSLAEETAPSDDDEPIDWPLALGLSLAGALFLVMAVGVAWM